MVIWLPGTRKLSCRRIPFSSAIAVVAGPRPKLVAAAEKGGETVATGSSPSFKRE